MLERTKGRYEALGKYAALFVLIAAVLLAVFVRVRLLGVPLERDEGEYAYAGQLILQGQLPYANLYNMKLPGIYAAYAVVLAVFGQTDIGIHLALLFMNLLTAAGILLLGRLVMDARAGVFAAAIFAIWSLDSSLTGVWANAEQFVILFATAGFVCLLHGLNGKRPGWLFGGGILLGLGFLMKQHGILFAVAGGLFLLIHGLANRELSRKERLARLSACAVGVAAPFLITCLIFWIGGAFDQFTYWTFEYASTYASQVPGDRAVANFKHGLGKFMTHGWAPLVLATLGLTALFWCRDCKRHRLFMLLFGVCSCLAIVPGFFFRSHYWILLLPAFSVLGGVAVSAVGQRLSGRAPMPIQSVAPSVLLVVVLAIPIHAQGAFFFKMTPDEASRSVFGLNPFPESKILAEFIRGQTDPGDTIAVIGSEPQVYFYARRRAATGYVYTYALMEEHAHALQMQKEMIREIEASGPRYVLFVRVSTSWLRKTGSHTDILSWWWRYKRARYELVGRTELYKNATLYHWAPDIPPESETNLFIEIWKRKS